MNIEHMMVFSGNANPDLANSIVELLGIPLGRARVRKHADGESDVALEENVRGKDVFVIQSTSAPVNNNLMELLVMIDALRWASAARITAVIPYFGYARQDRRVRSSRVPITARLVAKMIADAGAHRVLTIDLHSEQAQGFFDIPVDNIFAQPVLVGAVCKRQIKDPVIVSPDVGGVVRARAFAKCLDDADLVIIDKRRPRANEAEVMNIIGDVKGRNCVLLDDMIDTAGTLCLAGKAIQDAGANRIDAYCTHPVFSGNALYKLNASVFDEVVVTDTIRLSGPFRVPLDTIKQVSVASLLAETMRRIAGGGSVTALFS